MTTEHTPPMAESDLGPWTPTWPGDDRQAAACDTCGTSILVGPGPLAAAFDHRRCCAPCGGTAALDPRLESWVVVEMEIDDTGLIWAVESIHHTQQEATSEAARLSQPDERGGVQYEVRRVG